MGRTEALAVLVASVVAGVAGVVLVGVWFRAPIVLPAGATANYGKTDLLVGAWSAVLVLHWALVAGTVAALSLLSSTREAWRKELGAQVWTLVSVAAMLGAALAFMCAVAHATTQPAETRGGWLQLVVCTLCVGIVLLLDMRPPTKGVAQGTGALGILLLFPIMMSLAVGGGMTAQACNSAVRTPGLQRIAMAPLNISLYVNCTPLDPYTTNSSAVLLIGTVDHTASFYGPLLEALSAAGVPACAYDPAGSGFSDAGQFPRSWLALANELSVLLNSTAFWGKPAYELPSTQTFVAVGFGFGGFVARTVATMRPDAVGGVVLVDALSEFDPEYLGGALAMSPAEYVASVVEPATSRYAWERLTAALGLCLLHPLPYSDENRFPSLPPSFVPNQRSARCNGGSIAAAAQSASSLLYSFDPQTSDLTSTPLLVCASVGPFSEPRIGPALQTVQSLLVALSQQSSYQPFANSRHLGDLPVLWTSQLASSIAGWLVTLNNNNNR